MGRIKSNMTMEKFLRENEEPFLDQGNISFIAVGENDCPSGSKCEGYQLGGTYKLGEYNSKMLTTPGGEPMLAIDFELQLREVNPDQTYEIAFGMENGHFTESGSFFRDFDGTIGFKSAYEAGTLMETRTNDSVATIDFSTWTGEAPFDEPNKKFSATAMRVFNHVDKARELKLGAQHKWGTVFTVKNKQKKVVA